MPPWQAKVLAQQVFSHIPAGHHVNYLFQRHVTRGLPLSDVALRHVLDVAAEHVRGLDNLGAVAIGEGRFFEFGAGWDLHVAQLLYCLGVEQQTVVDIRRLLRSELVFDIRDRLIQLDAPLVRRPPQGPADLDTYLHAIGIDYRAPCDARATGLPSGSVDFVTSTNTLEHIPPEDIASILRECARLVGDRGVMSFQIDYQDHYSYFDRQLTAYHFLRYDERRWRWYNPSLHYQNRLRHSDYLALFDECGLEVIDATVHEGDVQDRETVQEMDLAPQYRTREITDLTARRSIIVLTARAPG